jgi:aryl-alcohol dehydrogenase-like predicted oxidoreductase
MEKRKLGTQGLEVSSIGLGCMGMSEFYGTSDEKECLRTLHFALELGIDFLDTADSYGPFKNEELLGTFLKGRRDQIKLATKFGIKRLGDMTERNIDGSPDYVRAACEASLKRLNTDYIDLYYLHRVDSNVPIEETVGAMSQLVKSGKVKYIGLSEASTNTIKRAHKIHPLSALQSEYSLWTRDVEEDILTTLRSLGIGLVAYSPLGRGFLTGNIKNSDDLAEDDFRRYTPRFVGEHFKKNLSLLRKIETFANRKRCTPAQLALAWVLAQGKDVIPIPGTKRVKFLQDNSGALRIKLSKEEMMEIDGIFPKNIAAGLRYPEASMKFLNN